MSFRQIKDTQEGQMDSQVLVLDFYQSTAEQIINQLQSASIEWQREVGVLLQQFQEKTEMEHFTSGTTGDRKRILHRKDQLIYSAQQTLRFFKLQPGARILSPLSTDFIAGRMMLIRAVVGRLRIVMIPPTGNPFDYMKEKQNFDFSALVPYQLLQIKMNGEVRLRELGTILIGGGVIAEELIKVLVKHNVRSYQSFGMTETLTHFAMKQLTPIVDPHYECLPDYSISIDGDQRLTVHNEVVFDQPLVTSDCIALIDQKRFNWLGRLDNVIKSGGMKLSAERIEEKIRSVYPKWPLLIISKQGDPEFGERPILVHQKADAFPDNVLELAAAAVNKYEKPAAVKTVRVFQYTSSGKIKRKELVFI